MFLYGITEYFVLDNVRVKVYRNKYMYINNYDQYISRISFFYAICSCINVIKYHIIIYAAVFDFYILYVKI